MVYGSLIPSLFLLVVDYWAHTYSCRLKGTYMYLWVLIGYFLLWAFSVSHTRYVSKLCIQVAHRANIGIVQMKAALHHKQTALAYASKRCQPVFQSFP